MHYVGCRNKESVRAQQCVVQIASTKPVYTVRHMYNSEIPVLPLQEKTFPQWKKDRNKFMAFQDVALCSLVEVYRHFGEVCCRSLQGADVIRACKIVVLYYG
jgi:hypothetical protein